MCRFSTVQRVIAPTPALFKRQLYLQLHYNLYFSIAKGYKSELAKGRDP